MKKTIEDAKNPLKEFHCPICKEQLYSPMDKLSIGLFDQCTEHLEEYQQNNLLKIAECL